MYRIGHVTKPKTINNTISIVKVCSIFAEFYIIIYFYSFDILLISSLFYIFCVLRHFINQFGDLKPTKNVIIGMILLKYIAEVLPKPINNSPFKERNMIFDLSVELFLELVNRDCLYYWYGPQNGVLCSTDSCEGVPAISS